MSDYKVVLTPRAMHDMDAIYQYIRQDLMEPETTKSLLDILEKGVSSLGRMPHRGAKRKVGKYADKGYRGIFVGNFTVVYKVTKEAKQVIVVAIRYSPSIF